VQKRTKFKNMQVEEIKTIATTIKNLCINVTCLQLEGDQLL